MSRCLEATRYQTAVVKGRYLLTLPTPCAGDGLLIAALPKGPLAQLASSRVGLKLRLPLHDPLIPVLLHNAGIQANIRNNLHILFSGSTPLLIGRGPALPPHQLAQLDKLMHFLQNPYTAIGAQHPGSLVDA